MSQKKRRQCPACKFSFPLDEESCPNCGTYMGTESPPIPIPIEYRICPSPSCGEECPSTAKFCPVCGEDLSSPRPTIDSSQAVPLSLKRIQEIMFDYPWLVFGGLTLLVVVGIWLFFSGDKDELPFAGVARHSSTPLFTTAPSSTNTLTLPLTPTPTITPSSMITPAPTNTLTTTVTPSQELGVGSAQVSPVDGMTLVYVPAGEFQMGSVMSEYTEKDERPVHSVYLNAYWVDKNEVTTTQFAKFLNENNLGYVWEYADKPLALIDKINGEWVPRLGYEDHPVTYVDWYGAKTYCEWAGKRLPTEAEWEKAAGGGSSNYRWPWGNEWDCNKTNAMTECDKFDRTAPVGSFPDGASPYGVLDMAGNLWEWVDDWYDARAYEYLGSPKNGLEKVLRGGSYLDDRSGVRTTDRDDLGPTYATGQAGFRCVMDVEGP